MTYKDSIEYLYNAAPAFEKVGAGAYKEGLANTRALDEHFHHPHRAYKTIHVAGTNGKGSTSHTLAAILQSAGMRVGLYTSPHLVTFRERIRVNGECIPEQRVVDFVEHERSFFEPLQPSFFELTTALAFKYFEEQKVDIAVVEVGLGGRLDCTNIISPILSVITNISLDHTQFLGHTLSEIAAEKGGIIKEGVPCLIGEHTAETRSVFERIAAQNHAPITFAQDTYINNVYPFELKGSYQERNKQTILHAIRLLQEMLSITEADIAQGMSHVCELTGLMGRWQTLATTPLTICDTGHNLAGWQYLAPQIKAVGKPTRIVFGMVDDKDINSVMALLPRDATFYFCQATTHRAIPASRVKDIAREHGINGQTFESVRDAYLAAKADSTPQDFIFIGGSSYVVADLLTAFKSF